MINHVKTQNFLLSTTLSCWKHCYCTSLDTYIEIHIQVNSKTGWTNTLHTILFTDIKNISIKAE